MSSCNVDVAFNSYNVVIINPYNIELFLGLLFTNKKTSMFFQ